jgi:hypothetical protein
MLSLSMIQDNAGERSPDTIELVELSAIKLHATVSSG